MRHLPKASVTLLTFAIGIACASIWPALYQSLAINSTFIDIEKSLSPKSGIPLESDGNDFPVAENCSCGEAKPKKHGMVSICVWNGKIIWKPVPAYPQLAKAAGIKGNVDVQIVVGETGEVIWAKAINGHPLLRPTARDAACRTLFTPTLLSGKPVQVRGILTYRFMLQ
jgi:TonB family protein